MALINVVVGPAGTIFQVSGNVCREDIIKAVHEHFPRLPLPDVIWDLSAASIANMSRADFEAISLAAKLYSATREFAKTVFIASRPDDFVSVCMYTGLAAMTEMQVDYSVCRTIEDAERWLVCSRIHQCQHPHSRVGLPDCDEKACRAIRRFHASCETLGSRPER